MIKKGQLSRRTSVHLDLIRGVAALAVMVGHVRGLFFIDYSYISNPSLVHKVIYAA